MNTLKINIPEGFVIDKFDESTGEVSFKAKPKEVKERITNFVDVLVDLNIDAKEFFEQNKNLPDDELAYKQLKLIVQAFNEGWTPDWTNGNQGKYYPWFKMGSPSGGGFSYYDCADWYADSSVGSRLCFKSSDLAKHAGQLFESIYKDFLTLNS